MPPKGADEGTDFGVDSLCAGGVFRRPGGEFLSARAERNQRAAKGWAQLAGTALPPLPPCCPPPGPPFTGVTPWARQNISGAQNLSGCLNFHRATGPWVCKDYRYCGSTTAPGLAEQMLPVRFPPEGRPLRSPGTRVGQCPAPTKRRNRFQFCRRGGCPHPPTLKGFSPFVGRGLLDAPFQIAAEKRRRGGCQPPASLRPSREKVPSVCEADEGGLRNGRSSSAGRPVSGPYEKKGGLLCSP